STTVSDSYQPKQVSLNFDVFGSNKTNTSTPVSNSDLTGSIATAGVKDLSGNDIMLVKSPNKSEIYEIFHGRKHLIPTMGIFADYGYTLNMVETISQQQLDKYPRAYLMRVYKDKKDVYYLTEG